MSGVPRTETVETSVSHLSTTSTPSPTSPAIPQHEKVSTDLRRVVSSTPERTEALSKPHYYHGAAVVHALESDVDAGLTTEQVKQRAEQYGPNMLEGGDEISILKIAAGQLFNSMSLVLILATGVSLGIESWIEGGVLAGVVAINVGVGFFQELSAEKTMNSLRSLASPTARVIRNGASETIPAGTLVPGDIIELSTGDTVPADARIIDSMNFEADEALLTGESLPVSKDHTVAFGDHKDAAEIGVGDRINMAYTSSSVSKGRATCVVTGIGMGTEIGKIAEALEGADKNKKIRLVKRNAQGKAGPHRYVQAGALTLGDKIGTFLGVTKGTPLQRRLSQLALGLFGVAILFAIIVFLSNNWSSREIILYAVSTGVSMIPASLTAVLTITMSMGSKAMVKKNVIVRKLDSLEALGGIQDICSDKTGTLTMGKMSIKKAWVPAKGTYSVSQTNEVFNPTLGTVSRSDSEPRQSQTSNVGDVVTDETATASKVEGDDKFMNFLNVVSLCNLATVFKDKESGQWTAHGDPTECALQTFACRFGRSRQSLTKPEGVNEDPEMDDGAASKDVEWKQIAEYPFDSSVKRMAVTYLHQPTGSYKALMKGAVERVLESCKSAQTAEGIVALTDEFQARVLENMEALAESGLRVLALAHRDVTETEASEGESLERSKVESGMVFLGLVGLYDPPRPESKGAVRSCKRAGIRVHMLTGDHPGTAKSIALSIGILPRDTTKLSKKEIDSLVMTAAQFDRLSDTEIDDLPFLPLVIARCAPSTKVRMVEALHRRKRFCAMSGDGVNDAPSLKLSDVGIAMGQAGSDVAKDASDLVLTDDNFGSIVNAIEEGRRMFDNIQKFILHLLAQNVAQACVLLIGLAFKDVTGLSVFPLSPVEILYVIMVTSGLPAMGLGMEKAATDVMRRPPHRMKYGVFTPEIMVDLLVYGLWMAALCLATFTLVVFAFGNGDLGLDCNVNHSDACDLVYRARGATWSVMTWFSLILAWEVTHLRRSFFHKDVLRNATKNRFLFICIALGLVSVFPILFIPGLNTQVFLHIGIGYEWAIVFITTILFVAGIELYKFGKRAYFRRAEPAPVPDPEIGAPTLDPSDTFSAAR